MRAALAALALVGAAPAAQAEEFYRKVGGWEVGETDGDCSIYQEYEGPGETRLVLTRKLDGGIFVALSNANWSAREGQEYDIAYVIDSRVFSGGIAVGYKSSNGGAGFVSSFGRDFLDTFARGSGMRVYLDKALVDDLSLAGTGAALAMLDRCMVKIRADKAAVDREQKRWEHLAPDPFAGVKPKPVINAPPVPIGSPANWTYLSDYPSAALREGRQGRTGFTVTVGPEGRVSACTITSSSGSADLDATACAAVTRRARFTPATDAAGKPTAGSWSSQIAWTIPGE